MPFVLDFGKYIAEAQYQFIFSLAYIAWLPHQILLTAAYYTNLAARFLMTRVFPLVIQQVITYITEAGLPQTIMTVAILLAAVSIVTAFAPEVFKFADLRKILLYGIAASIIFSSGPALMAQVDSVRTSLASVLYASVSASSGGAWGFGGSGSAPPWATFGGVDDYFSGSLPGISVLDVGMSALGIGEGEESSPELPAGFRAQFFPDESILTKREGDRTTAIQVASQGVTRLMMLYPLSIVAVMEGALQLMFSVAAFIILASIPLALLFAFFLPTEAIFLSLARQYTNLIVSYVSVTLLIAVGVSGLLAAAGSGNAGAVAAASIFTGVFCWYGFSVAKGSVTSSFTALTGAIATTVGGREPIGEMTGAVQSAVGTTVGLAGAGLALAAGAPMLAPAALQAGQSLGEHRDQEQAKGLVRTGLGFLGGKLMQGTSLAEPAQAVSMLGSFGGEDGIGGLAARLTASDAATAGLTSGSNPVAMMMSLDRTVTRRERMKRRYGSEDDDPNSPWRGEISQAQQQFGDEWTDQMRLHVRSQARPERAAEYVNSDGQLDMRSAGVRAVVESLPVELKQMLLEPVARQALEGMIGEAVMPKIGATREDLANAIAEAVREGAEHGAEAVAEKLGTSAAALGGTYGVINAIVERAQHTGMPERAVRGVLMGQPGYEPHSADEEDFAMMRGMLPLAMRMQATQLRGLAHPDVPTVRLGGMAVDEADSLAGPDEPTTRLDSATADEAA